MIRTPVCPSSWKARMRWSGIARPTWMSVEVTSIPSLTRSGLPSFSFSSSAPLGSTSAALRVSSETPMGASTLPLQSRSSVAELRDCNGRVLAPMGVSELTRNAVDVLPKGALEEKLKLGRPLRVKLGIDVTSPDIHVGRAIPLQRMRAFQDEGHTGVLIIGDYTTRIGDPSGRSAERPLRTDEAIDSNAR